MDVNGRYLPPSSRFPSAAGAAGLRPIADYVHSLGLKPGVHILRGIPKQAAERNLPIEGTHYQARDAADTSDTCPWNFDNYGIDPRKAAGQAYYDSIARLYASWQIDLIKVDCNGSHPYKGDEIRMLRRALDKTGRAIVLSVSPGPAPLEKAEELKKYAQMWRISDDIWDLWHGTTNYPQGVGDQFANAAKWAVVTERGIGRMRICCPSVFLDPRLAGARPGIPGSPTTSSAPFSACGRFFVHHSCSAES
jgi:hypothetical protein